VIRRGRAPVLTGARDKDPLATPQSPLTQLTEEQLAAAIEEEQRRARSRAPQVSNPAPGITRKVPTRRHVRRPAPR